MIIKENEFIQILKCPRLYSYQSTYEWNNLEIKLLKEIFTRISSLYIKNLEYKKENLYLDCVNILNKENKSLNLLDSQYESLLNSLTIYTSQLFDYFNINNYFPIFGPVYLNKTISKTTLKIKILGIFRSNNQTLHLVYFSPYSHRVNILNDPLLSYSSQEFFQFVKNHKSKRSKVSIHIFYYKDYKELGYINYIPKNKNIDYTNIIKTIEDKNYLPTLPCNYKCKFKNRCEGDSYV
tara:strand:+ start:1803 stop:2513 length:711 start_codon:yes stop_codon:yes gene_type:complete